MGNNVSLIMFMFIDGIRHMINIFGYKIYIL